MTRFTAIVWDWNGTLLDDVAFGYSINNGMLRRRGMKELEDLAAYRRIFRFPIKECYRDMGYTFETEPYETAAAEFNALYDAGVSGCGLRAGAEDALRALSGAGIRQFVLSVTEQRHLEAQVAGKGIAPFFEGLYGQRDGLAYGKTAMARRLLEENGLDPRTVLFIGDTLHDAETAGDCPCVLLSGGHQSEETLASSGLPVLACMEDAVRFCLGNPDAQPEKDAPLPGSEAGEEPFHPLNNEDVEFDDWEVWC